MLTARAKQYYSTHNKKENNMVPSGTLFHSVQKSFMHIKPLSVNYAKTFLAFLYRSVNRTKFVVALIIVFITQQVKAGNSELRTVSNNAFVPGEVLKFRIHYGFVNAGEAQLEVKSDLKNFGGRECYQFVGTGKSVGAFDWFFKVRDRYESITDKQAMVPWFFVRRVNEGGYIINQNVSFNHYTDSVKSEKATIAVPDNTQDIISAFYFARTLDFSNAKEGEIFYIPGYLDDEIFPMSVKFIGRETVECDKGKFRCIKLRPMLQEGRVFREQEDMLIWVSDDGNKIPVKVETKILVGSIKMDLVDYQNLANPPAKL
jgi:hypothetical protein